MLPPVSRATMSAMVTWCLVVAGTRTATAQALCPPADARAFEVQVPRAPYAMTVEADLSALRDTLPGATWRMPSSGGIDSDGVAIEGVSLTRSAEAGLGSSVHTFDVVVDLRAADDVVIDLELVVVDGERSLRLGAFKDVGIRCQAMSVSRKFSISDGDFASYFAAGRAPMLRVKRTTSVGGC